MKKLFVLFLSILLISSVSAAVGGLSQATISSNYFGFDKAWVIDFVSDDFTSDKINAFFSPSDFDRVGERTKQSLTVSANTKPSSCEWSLKEDTSSRKDVFKFAPFTASKWTTDFESAKKELKSSCADLGFGTDVLFREYSVFGSGKITVWCLKPQEKVGTVGNFVNKFIHSETDWSVSVSGKSSETATISNSESGVGRSSKLGDRVWIQWQGFASTGEDCPITEDAIPLHSNNFNGGWRIVKKGNYDSYNNYIQNSALNDIARWRDGVISTSTFSGILLSHSRNAISSNTNFGSFSVLNSGVSNGKIRIDLGRQIVFPQFRLIIDADYLELDIPTGKPKIVSVNNIEFTEGSAGRIKVTIRNDANSEAGFTTRIISCSNGFSSNTPPIGSKLNAQEEKTLTFELIGSTTSSQSSISGSCQVEMKESITGEVDLKSFDLILNQIRECPPPDSACGVEGGLHVIKQCNTEGTGLEVIETCSSEEICVEGFGGSKCEIPGEKGEGGFFSNLFGNISSFFKNLFSGVFDFFNLLKIIVTGVVFVGISAFLNTFLTNNKLIRIRNKPTRLIVSLIFGIGLAFFTFKFFFAGVITSLIIIIGIVIIKLVKPI